MKIIAQISSVEEKYCLIGAIYRKHKDIVKNMKKRQREIEFTNGDLLKLVPTRGEKVYGLEADVAIGPYAELITLTSDKAKKIWSFTDLGDYLKTIKTYKRKGVKRCQDHQNLI